MINFSINFSWLERVLTSIRITKKYIIDPRWWFNNTLSMLWSTCFRPSFDEESSKVSYQTASQVLWQLRKIALTNLSYSAFNGGIHLIAIWLEKVELVFPKKTKQDWHKSILLREGKYNSFLITITIQSSCDKFSGFFSYIFCFASPCRRLFLMLPNLLCLLYYYILKKQVWTCLINKVFIPQLILCYSVQISCGKLHKICLHHFLDDTLKFS